MNKLFIVILIAVVVVVGVYLFSRNGDNGETQLTATPSTSLSPTPAPLNNEDGKGSENGLIKEFTVVGTSFKFSVAEIRVKEGDTVRVTFKNQEGFHDWVLDEFNVKTQRVPVGQEETVQFVANKKGTFEYYCSVGNHRQQGMKGNLIVE